MMPSIAPRSSTTRPSTSSQLMWREPNSARTVIPSPSIVVERRATNAAAITNKTLGFEIPADRERMAGYGNFDLVMNTLSQVVSRTDYLAGPKFSAADLYVGSQIFWGMNFGHVERRPEFEAYWERLSQRPAARKAVALDDALQAA